MCNFHLKQIQNKETASFCCCLFHCLLLFFDTSFSHLIIATFYLCSCGIIIRFCCEKNDETFRTRIDLPPHIVHSEWNNIHIFNSIPPKSRHTYTTYTHTHTRIHTQTNQHTLIALLTNKWKSLSKAMKYISNNLTFCKTSHITDTNTPRYEKTKNQKQHQQQFLNERSSVTFHFTSLINLRRMGILSLCITMWWKLLLIRMLRTHTYALRQPSFFFILYSRFYIKPVFLWCLATFANVSHFLPFGFYFACTRIQMRQPLYTCQKGSF